jgi:hypothetical protein
MKLDCKKVFIYRHRTLDTNEVFYIGIGVTKKRSWTKHGRNKFWHNIVNKHGFIHEIIAEVDTREEAKELEIFLIQLYGRRDLGTGVLVNLTDGGDGLYNLSDEGRKRMSQKRLGIKKSDECRKLMSESQSRGKHSQAKKVIDESNGVIYACIKDASEAYGIGYHNLKDKLSGRKNSVNNTTLKYYNED